VREFKRQINAEHLQDSREIGGLKENNISLRKKKHLTEGGACIEMGQITKGSIGGVNVHSNQGGT